ncbi:MAG: tetratricopeptide repeat protein [Desulfovibrio sp.]|jgi:tetratricopeptide (TPR) repeat protein|nr:tetratricopeptide repeat protein [Desulfovibrio sp.]
MAYLSTVLSRLPELKDMHMATMGHVLWICWRDSLTSAVNQTLINYGGMLVCEEDGQSVWFFFSDDVFLALARLTVWGNFNDLPVCIELFPGRLVLSSKRDASLEIDGALRVQEMLVRDNLEIWVHPKSREGRNAMPGISFEKNVARQGMCAVEWSGLVVDMRMPYSSTRAWFAIIHPLGSPLDKAYQTGWDAVFKRLDALCKAQKIKSIVHEKFVMVSLENLSMLRVFLREYLRCVGKEYNEGAECWPCVCVVADRNNLNFNTDLPKKIGMQWDKLMPDFSYLSYRNAYLLGEGFTVRDLHFSGDQASMDSWCNVLLDEGGTGTQSIQLLMPGSLTGGDSSAQDCFYCGISSHASADCPTRLCPPSRPDIWEDLGVLDLEAANEGFRRIEEIIGKKGTAGYASLLAQDDDAALLLEAVLDISAVCQLRHVGRHWLHHMHDLEGQEADPPRDDSPVWQLLEELKKCGQDDLPELEKKLLWDMARQRDMRLHMLHGFLLVEKNDSAHAEASFREAARLTGIPTVQAWCEYLVARLSEQQGRYAAAGEQYAQVLRIAPQWNDARYRGIVCRVKMGFVEQVLDQVAKLVQENPVWFNRALIDPGMERGRLVLLSFLHEIWTKAKNIATAEQPGIEAVCDRINSWFPQGHPVRLQLEPKMNNLVALNKINNYIAFLRVKEERLVLEKEVNEKISNAVDDLRNRYKQYLDMLQTIRDEAAWFPFPAVLREFSSEFNECATIINWAFSCNFNEAESFQKAYSSMPKLAVLLRGLKKRLKTLRMVRDGTLFALTMIKTFFWVEIIGLVLCFIGVPVVVFWGDSLGLGWLKTLLGENQWSIQKVLVVIVSIVAFGLAALRTTLSFEGKREKLLIQARDQREKAQNTRLERIRKQRAAEVERKKRERKAEEEREMRNKLKERGAI